MNYMLTHSMTTVEVKWGGEKKIDKNLMNYMLTHSMTTVEVKWGGEKKIDKNLMNYMLTHSMTTVEVKWGGKRRWTKTQCMRVSLHITDTSLVKGELKQIGPENAKKMHFHLHTLFACPIIIISKKSFLLWIWTPAMLVCSLQMKGRKRSACECLIILQHMPALFMTSLTLTGHKMATLTVVFLRLSNVDF